MKMIAIISMIIVMCVSKWLRDKYELCMRKMLKVILTIIIFERIYNCLSLSEFPLLVPHVVGSDYSVSQWPHTKNYVLFSIFRHHSWSYWMFLQFPHFFLCQTSKKFLFTIFSWCIDIWISNPYYWYVDTFSCWSFRLQSLSTIPNLLQTTTISSQYPASYCNLLYCSSSNGSLYVDIIENQLPVLCYCPLRQAINSFLPQYLYFVLRALSSFCWVKAHM